MLNISASVKEYENFIGDLLNAFFTGTAPIRVRKSLKYRTERGYRSYSPIIDVSVGPFSEERGIQLGDDYNNLVNFSKYLIDDMLEQFRTNYEEFGRGFFEIEERALPTSYRNFLGSPRSRTVNWNARCFMAIEVENRTNPKHLLGDMTNVSISGRIGVVIGYNDNAYRTFLRQLDYLAYTVDVKKIKFNSRNIIVLKPNQFKTVLINNLNEAT